jgi:hypothetical protein
MVDLEFIAFRVYVEDRLIKKGYRTSWRYCSVGENVKVPNPDEFFTLGSNAYVVVSRIMPILADWRKYGTPPIVWAREVRKK